MDDLISRQAAIDFIDAGRLCSPNEPRWSDNEVVNFLKSRPSAQPEPSQIARDIATIIENEQDMRVILAQPHWIPVSERLPDISKSVLICDIDGDIYIGHRTKYGDYYPAFGDDRIKSVVAWMPLPEPYKEGQDGNDTDTD